MSGEAKAKTERVLAALEHREADRVPVGEFFWTNFLKRVKAERDVGDGFDPYRHWDLDMVVINPNMDPHLTGVEVIENTPERRLVRTGFGARIEQRADYPMPNYLDFQTQTYDDMEALEFDDPFDPRRYHEALDDQINSVTDTLNLGYPSFVDRVNAYADDFCVFGGVCEIQEELWRIVGAENVYYKMAEDPDRLAAFVERLGDFLVGIVEGQIEAAGGRLAGLYVWGDVAYDHGMLFSPGYWRRVHKPQLARICDAAHRAGLKVIYHGCGNALPIFDDLIEAGIDGYNPLEAKAGLDVVDLKRRFGDRLAFVGNINVQVLASGDREAVRAEVLHKLAAGRGGGYILQSDHSIPDNVSPATYDEVVRLARAHGTYPWDPGEVGVEG